MLHKQGKILALDLGTRRTGVALSDSKQRVAFARPEIEHKNENEAIEQIKNLCKKEELIGLVIGLPVKLDGSETKQTDQVKILIKKLEVLGLPILTVDERLSTEFAKDLHGFESKELYVDSRSAQILLETYLESLLSKD